MLLPPLELGLVGEAPGSPVDEGGGADEGTDGGADGVAPVAPPDPGWSSS